MSANTKSSPINIILHPRTALTKSEYESTWKIVAAYLRKNESIRNRDLRELTPLGYDQAIMFFKRTTEDKRLIRKGSGGGTYYVLSNS